MEDRISNLPDDILQRILSFLPMECAVTTSILSTRWRYLFTSIPHLDFSWESFAINRNPEQIADIVNRFLRLHSGDKIHRFRLYMSSNKKYLHDIEKWIEFATARRVEDLDLYFYHYSRHDGLEEPFKFPSHVCDCTTLKHLRLTGCEWYPPPPTFKAFGSLKTLYLSEVKLTQDMLDIFLSDCLVLEMLTLNTIEVIHDLKINAQNLPLKSLKLIDCAYLAYEMEIFAPSLISFHYYGDCVDFTFGNMWSLVDVILYFEDTVYWFAEINFERLQSNLANIKILSVYNGFLSALVMREIHFGLPICPYYNLKELQLMIDGFDEMNLPGIYAFFRNCPCPSLERFFIKFPLHPDPIPYDRLVIQPQEPLDYALDQLKTIKITNFGGFNSQMQLLKFLLGRASGLESLILVKPQKKFSAFVECAKKPLKELYEQVLVLNRSSLHAKIVIYEEDDSGLWPTHSQLRS